MEKKQENKLCCRVVLFPQPYIGHITPMLNLGNALHHKGFSINVIHTRFNSPNPTEFPNFNFHFIEDVLSKAKTPLSGSLDTITILNKSCLEPFRECLSQILEEASKDKEPVACLISDPLWEFTGIVADQLNVPRLALRTGGLLASILYESLPLLQEKGYFPLQDTRKEEPVLEIPPLKVKDLPPERDHDVLVSMVKETKSNCQGIICNTFKELEGPTLDRVHGAFLATPIFLIGPLHKSSPVSKSNLVSTNESSITWLNKHAPNSVLYVSFGTLAAVSKEQFLEVAWGLAKSQQPFLWVTRPRLINGLEKNDELFPEEFLETLNERGHIVTWAPQQQILAHPAIGGFWTHCGWNSTIESICEGVPMICFPFFGDQMMNARHVTDVLKVGLQLEKGLERQEINRAIRRLMVEKEGQEMRERITSLKEKADHCLVKGGSSYESSDQLTSHILSFCGAEKMKS
ncbi:UDP-glycosyltransferase 76B1 [Beta vulgaris subsp. vulgaris]|uniref:UDP-glycosyltransferase 76B1 n=1 Tax=Beta vulgaris subsp. vulgaris TaxID=3555 RepID=UPI002036D4D2|nr:UDP-glycosyltransferase 76B1 [Beta vulgaris subsp. vulgaris]